VLYGWNHPETVHYYEQYCQFHDRYRLANECLVAHADLASAHLVFDVAAGTGRTAEAALPFLGPEGRILCYEPATAMRAAGERRLADARTVWIDRWPDEKPFFDRILCGAAIWQMQPLGDTFLRLESMLRPGGALSFNIPSLYLGEVDAPGGGSDPLLLLLPALLAEGRAPSAIAQERMPSAGRMEELLRDAGLRPARWTTQFRMTQESYRDWMKIPVITDALFGDLDADERARRIEKAFLQTDRLSWKWEAWTGWIARK
jgi:SAM-dependent methyltransferase